MLSERNVAQNVLPARQHQLTDRQAGECLHLVQDVTLLLDKRRPRHAAAHGARVDRVDDFTGHARRGSKQNGVGAEFDRAQQPLEVAAQRDLSRGLESSREVQRS